jgi:ABC-type transporter lipoprotein component MlaA
LQAVDTRVKLLPATDFIERSDDSYIALRSAYLQKRSLIPVTPHKHLSVYPRLPVFVQNLPVFFFTR